MWIMLSDSFFSIVKKDCGRDELLVRARRCGDIEKVFPGAKVTSFKKADYRYRAPVKCDAIIKAMTREILRINYPNFKDSVTDDDLHFAYLKVWMAMFEVQA